MSEQLDQSQRAWRWRIFAITWLAYAGFYLCRKNLSVMMPLIAARLDYSTMQLAHIVFGYSLLYALGQFGCGVLADKFGSRVVVTVGLLVAVLSNLMMGFAASLVVLVTLACLNGAGQSAGWPGLVKNMAAWFRHRERGVVMAWWTTNYVMGGFVGTIFATFVVTSSWLLPSLGWRRGFWIPALVLFLITIAFFVLVRNRPSDAGLPEIVETEFQPKLAGRDAAPAAGGSDHDVGFRAGLLAASEVGHAGPWRGGAEYCFDRHHELWAGHVDAGRGNPGRRREMGDRHRFGIRRWS